MPSHLRWEQPSLCPPTPAVKIKPEQLHPWATVPSVRDRSMRLLNRIRINWLLGRMVGYLYSQYMGGWSRKISMSLRPAKATQCVQDSSELHIETLSHPPFKKKKTKNRIDRWAGCVWICIGTCLLLILKPSVFLVCFPGDWWGVRRDLTKHKYNFASSFPLHFPKLVTPAFHLSWFFQGH